MKICMLIYSFYPMPTGASRQALLLANKLQENGIEVFILTHGEKDSSIQEDFNGILVFRVTLSGGKFVRQMMYIFKTMWFLIKCRKRYNIIHIHGGYWLNYGAILIGKMLKKKVIIKLTLMGDDDPLSIKKKLFGTIQFFIFSLCDYFIAITPAAIRSCEIIGIPSSKSIHIPNGVDTRRFSPVLDYNEKLLIRSNLGLERFRKIAVFVGIKTKRKGVDLLIDAWKSVVEYFPDAGLLLIGSSKGKSEEFNISFYNFLKEKVNRYKIENNIVFLEEVIEIERYLKASDIFVLPSRAEGFPSVVIEAMSCGLSCVVSKIPGVTDYIIDDGKDGLIVEKEDIQGFYQAIKKIFGDTALSDRLGAYARQKIIRLFSIDKVVLDYIRSYERIMKC
jgi:glycosyltransferase involved in cell wall biosynthesis